MLIGRSQDCDIALQVSSKISRRHCCIVQCGDRYLFRDLGSMNGIRVNSRRVVEAELKAGDEVAVADVEFTFRVDEARGKRRDQSAPEDATEGAPKTPESSPERDHDRDPSAEQLDDEDAAKLFDDDLPADARPDEAVPLKDDSESEASFVRV